MPRILSAVLRKERAPRIRLAFYLHMARSGWPWDRDTTTRQLRKERWYKVKLLLLEILIEKAGNELQDLLIQNLTDKSDRVRSFVRAELERRFNTDCRRVYLGNIESLRDLRYSIIGLAECGRSTDAPLIKRFLVAGDAAVVNAAIVSLPRLKKDTGFQELGRFLYCDNKSTSDVTTRVLKGELRDVEAEMVVRSMTDKWPDHVYLNIVKLLRLTPKWDSIKYLLLLLNHRNEVVREFCLRWISYWIKRYNSSFVSPSLEQLIALEGLIDSRRSLLGDEETNLIAFTVRVAKQALDKKSRW